MVQLLYYLQIICRKICILCVDFLKREMFQILVFFSYIYWFKLVLKSTNFFFECRVFRRVYYRTRATQWDTADAWDSSHYTRRILHAPGAFNVSGSVSSGEPQTRTLPLRSWALDRQNQRNGEWSYSKTFPLEKAKMLKCQRKKNKHLTL